VSTCEREEHNDATTVLCCLFCQRPFFVPVTFYERMQGRYSCEQCVEIVWILRQPHVLYVRTSSQQELEGIAARLRRISTPAAAAFQQASSDSWSLNFWYDEIRYEVLLLLWSLQVRYSLENLHRDEDTLTFWPGDTTPKGILGLRMQEIRAQAQD